LITPAVEIQPSRQIESRDSKQFRNRWPVLLPLPYYSFLFPGVKCKRLTYAQKAPNIFCTKYIWDLWKNATDLLSIPYRSIDFIPSTCTLPNQFYSSFFENLFWFFMQNSGIEFSTALANHFCNILRRIILVVLIDLYGI